MKITVLGQWGAYPKAEEATAGYLFECNGKKVLIDCGSGVLGQVQKYTEICDLDAVIVTHEHHDHLADLGCLEYACLIDTQLGKRNKVLPIYVGREDRSAGRIIHYTGSEQIGIFDTSEIEVGGANITFFETLHEVHCLAVRIEFGGKKIVYTSDSQYSEELIGFSANADILIIETSFYKEFDASKFGHMNTVDVATIAQRAQVKKAVLTHLPHFGELERLVSEVQERYEGEVVLAHKGLTLTC